MGFQKQRTNSEATIRRFFLTGVDTEASSSGISATETGCSLTPWEQVCFSVECVASGINLRAAFETFSNITANTHTQRAEYVLALGVHRLFCLCVSSGSKFRSVTDVHLIKYKIWKWGGLGLTLECSCYEGCWKKICLSGSQPRGRGPPRGSLVKSEGHHLFTKR